MKLTGKSALIFGGTTGIGAASAELFVSEGASVTVVGRSEQGAQLKSFLRSSGGTAEFVRADVTKVDEIRNAIDFHINTYGNIDILFNNASKESDGNSVIDTSEEEFDNIMATNFKSVFMACKFVAPLMIQARKGVIINTSAASAREGAAWAGLGAYIGSKGAVIAFTRALAKELSPQGVRVNSLNPGLIDTPMLKRFSEKTEDPSSFMQSLNEQQLLGRVGQATELASAALFLASDDSSFITGSDLLVDGGLTLT